MFVLLTHVNPPLSPAHLLLHFPLSHSSHTCLLAILQTCQACLCPRAFALAGLSVQKGFYVFVFVLCSVLVLL